jgi:hypothetical protein
VTEVDLQVADQLLVLDQEVLQPSVVAVVVVAQEGRIGRA